jgi:hypothetical protein
VVAPLRGTVDFLLESAYAGRIIGVMTDLIQETIDFAVRFIHTELETGLTLAKVASTANNQDKIDRNRANARKAYDTALEYMARIGLPSKESAEIQRKLEELKRELQQLGESI